MPAYWAVEWRKLLTKGAQIKKPVNLPQQVVGGIRAIGLTGVDLRVYAPISRRMGAAR